jgi:hypothetical protein
VKGLRSGEFVDNVYILKTTISRRRNSLYGLSSTWLVEFLCARHRATHQKSIIRCSLIGVNSSEAMIGLLHISGGMVKQIVLRSRVDEREGIV